MHEKKNSTGIVGFGNSLLCSARRCFVAVRSAQASTGSYVRPLRSTIIALLQTTKPLFTLITLHHKTICYVIKLTDSNLLLFIELAI